MSEQAKFSVKGLDLYYGDFHALKDVNLDINACLLYTSPSPRDS